MTLPRNTRDLPPISEVELPASSEPIPPLDIVEEIFWDEDGNTVADYSKAVSGEVTTRLPDGSLQRNQIVTGKGLKAQ